MGMDVLARRAQAYHPAPRVVEPAELRSHRAVASDIQIASPSPSPHDQPRWAVGAEQALETKASREARIRGLTIELTRRARRDRKAATAHGRVERIVSCHWRRLCL